MQRAWCQEASLLEENVPASLSKNRERKKARVLATGRHFADLGKRQSTDSQELGHRQPGPSWAAVPITQAELG